MPEARAVRPLTLPRPHGQGPVRSRITSLARGSLSRMLRLGTLNDIYAEVTGTHGRDFLERALSRLGIDIRVQEERLEHIPRTGPLVVVANHPFGAVEGLVLARLIGGLRPDVKFMANQWLGMIPEITPLLIPVDPFGGPSATMSNIRGLKDGLAHVKEGGALILFPAGEVSSLNLKRRTIADPPWSPVAGRIIRRTKAPVLPIYFKGFNSALFHLSGLIHPRLRTVMLPRELLAKRDRTIEVRIGSLIDAGKLAGLEDDRRLADYLRLRTYILGRRQEAESGKEDPGLQAPGETGSSLFLEQEIHALPESSILLRQGGFTLAVTTRDESPGLIREIGRQREICFRAVGEGTGRELDLDEFDNHYDHLILWHDANREVAGAYRIGRTDRILADQGPKGLYTNTLFRFSRTFLDSVNPGLELGRAFVAGPYQKSYAPLLTLWKGIGAYVAAAPRYAALFGPVSITNDYNPFSRQIMVGFLKAHNWLSTRRRLIRPKAPFRSGRGHIGGLPIKSVSRMCASIEDVSSVIAEMETDGKGVPVLLRQYLKLGGKLVGFNVDHDFAGALDGLMLVDLTRTDAKILERYMGKEAAAGFLAHHAASTPDLCA